jgi:trimeric autotransporter adhesin
MSPFRCRLFATCGWILLGSTLALIPRHAAQAQSDRGRGGASGGSSSTTVESRVAALEAALATMHVALESQANQMADLQSTVAAQANRIASLESTVGDQASQITSLNTTASDQASQIASLNTTITQQAGQLAALQTKVASQADQLASLTQGAADLLEKVTRQADQLAALQAGQSQLQVGLDAEASARQQGAADLLTAARTYADQKDGETLASAQAYAQDQVAPVADKLVNFSRSGNDLFITGANLHILNGLGSTETGNGLGNLIVGYNEPRGDGDDRTGSHNIVVGQQQNFSSYGGLAAGFHNDILGPFASVTGGTANTASALGAWVGGGQSNTAGDPFASVTGGPSSTGGGIGSPAGGEPEGADGGEDTSTSGGPQNTTPGDFASASGKPGRDLLAGLPWAAPSCFAALRSFFSLRP